MRSKKAQILEMAVVFIFITLIIFLYGNTAQNKDVVATIGAKQYLILDSYVEAEKAKEYVELAAKLSALQVEGIGSGENCFAGLDENTFGNSFENNIAEYLNKIISSRDDLTVNLPEYVYRYSIEPNELIILGYSNSKIDITGNNLEYKANHYFKQTITCDKKDLVIS